jgi:hypothetical protein
VLSIDFVGGTMAAGGGTGIVPSTMMDPTEMAGVKPVAHWNSALGAMDSLTPLTLDDGTIAASTVTWSSPGMTGMVGVHRNRFVDAPGDVRMMAGYLDPGSPTASANITVSNLPAPFAASGYDVYVYVTGDVPSGTTRMYKYVAGGSTMTVTQVGSASPSFTGFVLAPDGGSGNYIVFRRLSGSSFVLLAGPGAGAQIRSPVDGIQIVSPPGS